MWYNPTQCSDLVNQDAPGVEESLRTFRKDRVAKDHPVIAGVSLVVRREGGITHETPGIVVIETDGVDVERADGCPPKSPLHGSLLAVFRSDVVKPVWARCPGCALQGETEASAAKCLVQDIDLLNDLGISEIVE